MVVTSTRKAVIDILERPPAPRAHHIDRIPWDQAEIIADAIINRMADLYEEQLREALGPLKPL